MRILFYLGYADIVGYGSEISFNNIAREMIKDNNEIYVLSKGYNKSNNYKNIPEYKIITDEEYLNSYYDIIIISRYVNFYLYYPIRAKKVVIWVHDITLNNYYRRIELENGGRQLIENVQVDKIITQTEYHKNIFNYYYPNTTHLVEVIGNGNNINRTNEKSERNEFRFIYTSCPSRGLKYLLSIFPEIKKRYSKAELYIYRDEDAMKDYKYIDSIDGVKYMGKIDNSEIINVFSEADIWLYPTEFTETFCMSAIEAMAGGCLCIASNYGALSEVIGDAGIILKEKYGSDEYKMEIFNAIDKMISNREYYRENGYKNVKKRTYEYVYKNEWKKLFNELMNENNSKSNDKEKRKINLLCNWTNKLNKDWEYLIDRKNFDYEMTNETNCNNFTIVINSTNNFTKNELKNGYHISMEPILGHECINENWRGKGDIDRNIAEWHLGHFHGTRDNLTYEQIENICCEKTVDFVTIMGGITYLPRHRQRLEFLKLLSSKINIDIYGKHKLNDMNTYKGYSEGKLELLGAKYTLSVENSQEIGYFTEKIHDGILAECLVFYDGCPNIYDYIDQRAIICIDIYKPEKSINIIMEAIKNNEWEKRLKYIRNEKKRIMRGYSVGPTIKSLINNEHIEHTNTFILNLNHRFDRWEDMTNKLLGFPYRREEAINGQLLTIDEIYNIPYLNVDEYIIKNWHYSINKNCRGEIGCIMSHINIWKKCLDHEINLIFEDDCEFSVDFKKKWITLKTFLKKEKNWDIVYLGYIDDAEYELDTKIYNLDQFSLFRFSDKTRKRGGGTGGYVLSNRGAKKLLEYVDIYGVKKAIDWFMIDLFPKLDAYICRPHLMKQMYIDSDIR